MLRITTLGAYVTLRDTCVVYSVASIPLGASPLWIPGVQDTTTRLVLMDFRSPHRARSRRQCAVEGDR